MNGRIPLFTSNRTCEQCKGNGFIEYETGVDYNQKSYMEKIMEDSGKYYDNRDDEI